MKKFILGLFLILGVVSFAAARGLDINKVNKLQYSLKLLKTMLLNNYLMMLKNLLLKN